MKKTDIDVRELVDMITRGELRLPEMQRQYVWRATRVRDLLDSLYRGYPSGSILVWETDERMPTRDLAVEQSSSPFSGHKLLLDGQQRLTSLSAVLRGEPIHVRGRKRPIEILFNLEHPDILAEAIEVEDDDTEDNDELDLTEEENENDDFEARFRDMTFVVASRRLASLPNWISVTEVFKTNENTPFLKKAGVQALDDPRVEKFNQRLQQLRAIREYPFTMQVLERHLSYEEVTEIFIRVNSLGAKVRGSDLALAQITANWRNSLSLFEAFQQQCQDNQFDLELGVIVRSLIVFATDQCRFLTVSSLPQERLEMAWKETKYALEFAIDFLCNNAGIDSPVLLSSPFFVIATAYFAHILNFEFSKELENKFLYWLHTANAKGLFSGSSETKLDQDLAIMRKTKDPGQLIEHLSSQVGRFEVRPTDFTNKNRRSPLYKTMFMALRAKGAKDWFNGLAISISFGGSKHSLQDHHIFPKAYLRESGYSKFEINDIANMAFICGTTNRRISKKPPLEYFPGIIKERGKESLATQCIPLENDLLISEQYNEFLVRRRQLLAEVVNDFLNRFLDG